MLEIQSLVTCSNFAIASPSPISCSHPESLQSTSESDSARAASAFSPVISLELESEHSFASASGSAI
jgi:hypothetical protein